MPRYILPSLFLLGSLFLFSNRVFSQSFSFQQKVVAMDRDSADFAGTSVASSSNWMIVGATGDDVSTDGGTTELERAGAAYLFRRSAATEPWEQVQRLVASDPSREDEFGFAVAITDDYALVSTFRADEDANGENELMDAGAVYVFERQADDEWLEVQKIVAPDRAISDNFGRSVTLSGEYVFVGSPYTNVDAAGENQEANAGGVYVFARQSTGQWEFVQKITPADRNEQDLFGWSVAVHNDQMVVGAYAEDHNVEGAIFVNNAGAAYFFAEQTPGNWVQTQKVIAPERGIQHFFGWSVDIYGEYAIVGASEENVIAPDGSTIGDAGAAYIFRRAETGAWSFVDRLVDEYPDSDGFLGHRVAIRPPFAVAGAYRESFDGNEENVVDAAGAAFLYTLGEDDTWAYQQKLVAPDRAAFDFFGRSLAITEDEILVGAVRHGGGAVETDFVPLAGAVYSFRTLPTRVAEITSPISFQLGPNPTADYCRVTLDEPYRRVILSLSDAQGQLLYQLVGRDQMVFELSLRSFPAGTYFLRMDADGIKSGTAKIVVH